MPQNPGIVETYPARMLERFNKSGSQYGKSVGRFREVLDCGSPLALFHRSTGSVKRQRAAAVQDAGARFDGPSISVATGFLKPL
jgi:hypothetical protein